MGDESDTGEPEDSDTGTDTEAEELGLTDIWPSHGSGGAWQPSQPMSHNKQYVEVREYVSKGL